MESGMCIVDCDSVTVDLVHLQLITHTKSIYSVELTRPLPRNPGHTLRCLAPMAGLELVTACSLQRQANHATCYMGCASVMIQYSVNPEITLQTAV